MGASQGIYDQLLLTTETNESGRIVFAEGYGDKAEYGYIGVANDSPPPDFLWSAHQSFEILNLNFVYDYENVAGVVSLTYVSGCGVTQDQYFHIGFPKLMTISANGANIYMIAPERSALFRSGDGWPNNKPTFDPVSVGDDIKYDDILETVDFSPDKWWSSITANRNMTSIISKSIGTHVAYNTGTLSASPDGYRVDLIGGTFDTSVGGLS